MDLQRSRLVGFNVKTDIPTDLFYSSHNIDELSLIAIDLRGLHAQLTDIGLANGGLYSRKRLDDFEKLYVARTKRILEWVGEGHTLVLIPNQFPLMLAAAQPKPPDYVDINGYMNFGLYSLEPHSGLLAEAVPGPMAEVLSATGTQVQYSYSIKAKDGIALFRSSSDQPKRRKVVGVAIKHGRGIVLVVPPLKDGTTKAYLIDLEKAVSLLPDAQSAQPDWVAKYQSQSELTSHQKLIQITQQITKLDLEAQAIKSQVDDEQAAKRLFSDSDESLVDAVIRALHELGLKAVKGTRLRGDILIWDGKRLAVAEVKGVEKAAKGEDLRQAEKWVADVRWALAASPETLKKHEEIAEYIPSLEALGVPLHTDQTPKDCRGLMIINAFYKKPLSERTESAFGPFAKEIERSRIGAMTGLNLYCLLEEIKKTPSKKSELIEAIFNHDGVLPAPDWGTVLKKPN